MKFIYDDGGRKDAGYAGKSGDCVARAIAIATLRPYLEIADRLGEGCREQRVTKGGKPKSDGLHGVNTNRKWFKDYMVSLGFRWVPTMGIGTGCRVHLRDGELPMGRLVVNVSKHFCAVIDGVIRDTYNPDRDGTRCVYGYWIFEGGSK